MFKISIMLGLIIVLGALLSGNALATISRISVPKKAILLVAFGTSVPEAQKVFEDIEKQTSVVFPGVEVRWAFTSKTIRAKLAKEGRRLDSPESALARLMDEGYTHVAVLSLHVIPGKEFHDLSRNVLLFGQMASGFQRILVAPPLISSHEDMERVARFLLNKIPFPRKPDEAVIFMGHGNKKHPADAMYSAMNYVFQNLNASDVFVATVDGYPGLEDIIPKLTEKGITKVFLIPFMAVAGDHARNDMAGDGPESWKSILKRNGFNSQAVLAGMGEYPEIVEVWLDHLRETYSQL